MAWRKKTGALKDVLEGTVAYESKGGVEHPLQLKDSYENSYSMFSNFSSIVYHFGFNEGLNNLSIKPNPEFFQNGSLSLKHTFLNDADMSFAFETQDKHLERIIGSLAGTLENRHYGRDKRVVVEIPHSVSVDGKTYQFKEHIWNDKKDLHMPDEVLKRKRSKIKSCNVDLAKGKTFNKELETVGKIAEAVALEAEKLGYENVTVKQMKNAKEEVVGVQFCVPTVPYYETDEELRSELRKQENLTVIDNIKDQQKGVINIDNHARKIAGWYQISNWEKREDSLFGYVGDNLLLFDGLEEASFDEKYTRPTTELIQNGLHYLGSNIGNAIKGAYNYSGAPRVFGGIAKSMRESEEKAKKAEADRQEFIFNSMKAAGFVKPQKNKGSEFDRCVIILNEDAVEQEAVSAETQK